MWSSPLPASNQTVYGWSMKPWLNRYSRQIHQQFVINIPRSCKKQQQWRQCQMNAVPPSVATTIRRNCTSVPFKHLNNTAASGLAFFWPLLFVCIESKSQICKHTVSPYCFVVCSAAHTYRCQFTYCSLLLIVCGVIGFCVALGIYCFVSCHIDCEIWSKPFAGVICSMPLDSYLDPQITWIKCCYFFCNSTYRFRWFSQFFREYFRCIIIVCLFATAIWKRQRIEWIYCRYSALNFPFK